MGVRPPEPLRQKCSRLVSWCPSIFASPSRAGRFSCLRLKRWEKATHDACASDAASLLRSLALVESVSRRPSNRAGQASCHGKVDRPTGIHRPRAIIKRFFTVKHSPLRPQRSFSLDAFLSLPEDTSETLYPTKKQGIVNRKDQATSSGTKNHATCFLDTVLAGVPKLPTIW